MKHVSSRWQAAIVMGTFVLVAGCSYGPLHDSNLGASRQADFKGFATAPSITVRVQAYRWSTGVWETLATTTSDPTPWAGPPPFTTNLYGWYVYPTVPLVYFNASKQARLRAQQQSGSSWVDMYMYDQAGFECLSERFIEEAFDGDDEALNARNNGIECSDDGAGGNRFEVTVTIP